MYSPYGYLGWYVYPDYSPCCVYLVYCVYCITMHPDGIQVYYTLGYDGVHVVRITIILLVHEMEDVLTV